MFERFTLRQFLAESNRIEGIRGVKHDLIVAAETFLAKPMLFRQDMIDFVKVAQPNAVIRDRSHLNVRVGNHIAPQGGPEIVERLDRLLEATSDIHQLASAPYLCHQQYETLHPFTDGNGRSGRILWLWMMGGVECAPLGFLHHWYYDSLRFNRHG